VINVERFLPPPHVQYENYLKELKKCKGCGLRGKGQHYCPGWGNLNSKVMFIGEAPGRVENPALRGLAFVGNRSSDMFYKALSESFGHYIDVFTTNVVKCNPPPDNSRPTSEEIAYCKHFLLTEISIVQPEMIVLLGRVALETLVPDVAGSSIESLQGKRLFCSSGIPTYVTYHPSYALRCGPKFQKAYCGWFKILKRKLEEIVDGD